MRLKTSHGVLSAPGHIRAQSMLNATSTNLFNSKYIYRGRSIPTKSSESLLAVSQSYLTTAPLPSYW